MSQAALTELRVAGLRDRDLVRSALGIGALESSAIRLSVAAGQIDRLPRPPRR